jgi:hypothetical protein
MSEKKEIREQIAFQDARRPEFASEGRGRTRQRVVTTPHSIVRPAGWTAMAERREQQWRLLRQRTRAGGQPFVARSLAQTGVRASSGQMRALRPGRLASGRPATPIPRRSSRIRRRRAGRRGKWLAGLLTLLIALGACIFALTGPAFRIQQVTVAGTQNRALIAQIQQLGLQGQNILLIDTAALSRRIAALPPVASVSIERRWPNQLQVTIGERVALLLWRTAQGSYSVDRTGMVIAPASETPGAEHLQVVLDRRDRSITDKILPGAHIDADEVKFAAEIFKEVPLLTKISSFTLRYESKIYVSNAGSAAPQTASHPTFVIASPAGWVAYLGGPDDANPLANRLRELQQILVMAQQKGLHLATIDLRFGLNAVYTLQP